MHRIVPRLLSAVLAVAVMALFAACGGDDDAGDGATSDDGGSGDELTLAAYFDELDAIFERADSDSDEAQADLDDALNEAGDDLEAQIAAVDAFLTRSIETFDPAIADMNDLAPPPEVTSAHDDFLDAVGEASQLAANLQEGLQHVETQAEADELIRDFDLESSQLVARADEVCLDLQEIADENGVDVDLDCED